MLVRPNQQVLSALASLQGNASFETVRAWLEDSRQHLYSGMSVTKDEVLTRWQQGAVQAVDELLETACNAQEVIRKSR
jgi:hypothetical protein